MDLTLLPTDQKFTDSPDAGHPKCLCSRCGKRIEEWHSPCLRAMPENENAEYRFHWGCVGGRDRTKEEWQADQDEFFDSLDHLG